MTKKGFSIIELMVAVAIMALLTAIVVANFSGSRKNARDAKKVSDLAQLQLALELYFDRCNQYPEMPTSGAVSMTLGSASTNELLRARADGCPTGYTPAITFGTFISAIPVSSTYTYAINTADAPVDYVLRATLESRVPDDDIDTTFGTVVCSDYYLYYCVRPR